jgi:hypothetical protein
VFTSDSIIVFSKESSVEANGMIRSGMTTSLLSTIGFLMMVPQLGHVTLALNLLYLDICRVQLGHFNVCNLRVSAIILDLND